MSERGPLLQALEAVLFVSDEPLPSVVLAQALGIERREADELCALLASDYEERGSGITLRSVAGGWRLTTHPDAAPVVEQYVLASRHTRLTKAALETLAIVAYLGPCSRPEVARIRGVAADSAIASLVERGLITEAGRESGPGGAVRYRTTPLFERVFGLETLASLPRLDDLGDNVDELRDRLLEVAEARAS